MPVPCRGVYHHGGKTTIVYSMYNIINHVYTTTTAIHFHVPRSSPQSPRSQIQVPKLSHAASHAARRSAPTPPDAHATHCLSSTRPPRRRRGTNYGLHHRQLTVNSGLNLTRRRWPVKSILTCNLARLAVV